MLGDARALQKSLGSTDRRKMDEYLTAVRETEVAIDQDVKFRASLPRPTIPRPDGIPGDFTEHVRIMYDLLGFALQTDSTRIASFMVLREGSNRPYPFIGVNEGHHDLSHHGNSAEKKEKIAKINRFHIEQFAGFLAKLKTMREQSGTVLDNSMIVPRQRHRRWQQASAQRTPRPPGWPRRGSAPARPPREVQRNADDEPLPDADVADGSESRPHRRQHRDAEKRLRS